MPLEEILENYDHFIVRGRSTLDANGNCKVRNIECLWEMLRYKGCYVSRYALLQGRCVAYEKYTCAHLNSDGKCKIYEDRPATCRAYNKCEYKDCESTWCSLHSSRN